MTAEIGVLNRIGVALAADSAVSIGHDADKIWTSADKLFNLSCVAPVGIMVYGNANFAGVPWETVVKEYRKQLGEKTFPVLKDYADDFFAYLSENENLIQTEARENSVKFLIGSLLHYLLGTIKESLENEVKAFVQIDDQKVQSLVDEAVKHLHNALLARPMLIGFNEKVVGEIRDRYGAFIEKAKNDIFGQLPMGDGISEIVSDIPVEMLVRNCHGPSLSGIVIAGFGDNEAMPSLLEYEVEEMVLKYPRRKLKQDACITVENTASIIPFAQQESVHSFLNGVDPLFAEFMKESSLGLMNGTVELILDCIGKKDDGLRKEIEDIVSPELDAASKKLFENWDNQRARYWRPIVNIVSSLPKDELAAMSEALVNLTKFRRRISPDRETVGGPIDVAVITKGDGFIWVKRKHYFSADKNPRALARYGKEV